VRPYNFLSFETLGKSLRKRKAKIGAVENHGSDNRTLDKGLQPKADRLDFRQFRH
jgi:hypothetical protein